MAEILIIRPGATDFDDQKRVQGTLDLPLNERGRRQTSEIIAQLRGVAVDAVYCGPCEPARSTAAAIAAEFDLPLKEVDEFRNLDCGLWQGLQLEEVRRKFPKAFKQWQECPENVCPPEGETVSDALHRLDRALRKCVKRKKLPAIVAQEPLASLLRSALSGCKPCVCSSGVVVESSAVERISFHEAEPRSEGLLSRALGFASGGRSVDAGAGAGDDGASPANAPADGGRESTPITPSAWPGLAQ